MSVGIGTQLGSHEITALLGKGGMGEVYRARDTKLKREVAIKILPDEFSFDADRVSRFQREAEVLASLNHPNIADIYDLQEAQGSRFLVLELVEGETLAERLKRGPLPIDEVLSLAKSICEALEAAHEKGVIHRDLKPANVKITPDGKVKVLDFGLAKALENVPAGANLSNSPTVMSIAGTRAGMILGTAAYMSPEQARGISMDRRSDIFSFGAVLFEMLTGREVFQGEMVSDVLAAVLKEEPDWKRLPPDTPESIRRLLRRCLTKNRPVRLADIADAIIEINDAFAEPAKISSIAVGRRNGVRWAITAALLSAALSIGATVLVQRARPPQQDSPDRSIMRLQLDLPAGVELYTGGLSVAVSPDGTRAAFIGVVNGTRQIYIRRLDQPEVIPLGRGTETVSSCFFSPDGSSLGFLTADNSLKKVSLTDGSVNPLATDVDTNARGAWGADDHITFVRAGTLWQVPAGGGAAKQLTGLDRGKGELSHRNPTVVGDGRVVLFTVVTGSDRRATHIEALSLASGQRQVLVNQAAISLYAPSGHLVFSRDNALFATSFDLGRLVVTSQPVRIVEDLALDLTGTPIVALSHSGALLYPSSEQAMSKLVWVSRQGLEQPITSIPRSYANPRVSPDGRLVLVTANGDLWVQDTMRMTFTRLTSDATAGNSYAAWTPDGKKAVFRTPSGIQWMDTDGSGRSQVVPDTSTNDYPNSVAPDGSTLAFTRMSADKSGDVYVLSLRGESKPHPVVTTSAYEGGPQFSPDGRWLAYASDESGEFQIYMRSLALIDDGRSPCKVGGTLAGTGMAKSFSIAMEAR